MAEEKSLAVLADNEAVELLKRQLSGEDLTDDEFEVFLRVARERGLDPFKQQVIAQKRRGRMSIVTTIAGYRLIAERNPNYQGPTSPQWTRDGRTWFDVWVQDAPPLAARVGVRRKGFAEPVYGIATRAEYLQTNREGQPSAWWAKNGGAHMLAKCAESLAIRRAFPDDVAGIYTKEEMGQASIAEEEGFTTVTVDPEATEPQPPPGYMRLSEMTREEIIEEMRMHVKRIGRERCKELVPNNPTEIKDARLALSILREEPDLAPKVEQEAPANPPERPVESHLRKCVACGRSLPARRRDPKCETCTINEAHASNAERAAELETKPDEVPQGSDREPYVPAHHEPEPECRNCGAKGDIDTDRLCVDCSVLKAKVKTPAGESLEQVRDRVARERQKGQKSREVDARNKLAAEAEAREREAENQEHVGPKEGGDEHKPWEKYASPGRKA